MVHSIGACQQWASLREAFLSQAAPDTLSLIVYVMLFFLLSQAAQGFTRLSCCVVQLTKVPQSTGVASEFEVRAKSGLRLRPCFRTVRPQNTETRLEGGARESSSLQYS